MNKGLVALVFCGLILNTFAIQMAPQMALLSKQSKLQLQKSSIGRAIIGLAQLHEKAGADLTELFDALTLLKESLTTKQAAEEKSFAEDETTHTGEVARLEVLIKKYEGQVDTYGSELDDLKTQWANLNDQLGALLKQQKDNKTQRDQAQQSLEAATAHFQQETADFNQAIALLNKANDELKTAKAQAGKGVAFIQNQEHKQQIENLRDEINVTLERVQENHTIFLQPVVAGFLALTNKTSNPESIQKAIEAIDGLIKHFIEGLKTLNTTYKAEKEQLDKKIAHHNTILEKLEQTQIPNKNAELDDNEDAQKSKSAQINEASQNLKTENENLDQENAYWDEKIKLHEELVIEFKKEIDIVIQAEEILKKANAK